MEIINDLEFRIRQAMRNIPSIKLPIILEFAGLPGLGKSTAADSMLDLFKKSGYKARLASFTTHASAIDDKLENRWNFDFSAWKFFSTLKIYLELRYSGVDLLIADRGIFDALLWLRVKSKKGFCKSGTCDDFRKIAFYEPWQSSLMKVVIFTGDKQTIIERSRQKRLYKGPSVVTTDETLNLLETEIHQEAEIWKKNVDTNIIEIFHQDKNETLEDMLRKLADLVVSSLEDYAKEA